MAFDPADYNPYAAGGRAGVGQIDTRLVIACG
jgi:hypothetical protein